MFVVAIFVATVLLVCGAIGWGGFLVIVAVGLILEM